MFGGGTCNPTKFKEFLEACTLHEPALHDPRCQPLHDLISNLYLCIFCLSEKQSIVITVSRYYNLPDCSTVFIRSHFQNDNEFKENFLRQVFNIAISALEFHSCFHCDLRLPNILFDYHNKSFKIIDWETSLFLDFSNITLLNNIFSNTTKYPLTSSVAALLSNINLIGLLLCEQLAYHILEYVFTNTSTGILNFYLI